jgi:signal peptidase I
MNPEIHDESKNLEESNSGNKVSHSFLKEIIHFALIALFVVLPIRIFIAQPFIVSGSSMDPTFENGEYLIIDEISYRFNEPERGDVVVFKYPKDKSKFFIKRIIGLPEEKVEIIDGEVYIESLDSNGNKNRLKLEEGYLEIKNTDNFSLKLNTQEYFVMGDNRSASFDSRSWGPLPEDLIRGKAFLRLLPINRVDVLPGSIKN